MLYEESIVRKCLNKDKDDRPDSKQKYCLYTSDGKKLLGRHPSKEKALKQEKAIQVNKHSSDDENMINNIIDLMI